MTSVDPASRAHRLLWRAYFVRRNTGNLAWLLQSEATPVRPSSESNGNHEIGSTARGAVDNQALLR
jgi:hypothetical protein